MAHLGDLGRLEPVEPLTFGYFGETITVAEFSDIDYLEYVEGSDEKRSSLRFLQDISRMLFDDDNYDRFWAARRRGRQSLTDVMDVLMGLVTKASDRPTGQPSESSDGQQDGEARSAGSSSSVEEQLAGRPDLQLVVAQAQEALAS